MHSTQNANRSLVFIAIAVGIAFILIALSLTVQYSDSLYAFCASMAHSPPAMLILNFLFFWLLVLLVLALRHWHRISSLNSDLEAVVSSISPDALLVVTPQRTVRMCNDSVERIFGYKPSEIIDHTTDMLYYDRRANTQHTREIFDVLARSGFHYGVATGKRKGGGTVPLEIISGELVGKNGAVLLVRDITERQAFEEQRRRLEQRALQAQKLESLGVLAGGVAHDFNNLLMIINGYVELMLLRQPADAGQNDSLLEIQKAANRACDICGSLLSFAGRAPRQIRPVSVTQVAEGAAKMVSVRVPPRVQVQLELAAEPPLIEGDAGQLHQIAMNLINNACEAIGNAPGHVSVSTGERVCDSDYLADAIGGSSGLMAGAYVFLRVADSGCGMDDATRRRICEPFFTTKREGHGMGMAAVLGIVRSHHGTIKVESALGKGSTFTVLFPKPISETAVAETEAANVRPPSMGARS